jgi:hypothetical protein
MAHMTLLAGELPPVDGRVTPGEGVHMAVFSQDLAQDLPLDRPGLDYVLERARQFDPLIPMEAGRAALGSLGLIGSTPLRPIGMVPLSFFLVEEILGPWECVLGRACVALGLFMPMHAGCCVRWRSQVQPWHNFIVRASVFLAVLGYVKSSSGRPGHCMEAEWCTRLAGGYGFSPAALLWSRRSKDFWQILFSGRVCQTFRVGLPIPMETRRTVVVSLAGSSLLQRIAMKPLVHWIHGSLFMVDDLYPRGWTWTWLFTMMKGAEQCSLLCTGSTPLQPIRHRLVMFLGLFPTWGPYIP